MKKHIAGFILFCFIVGVAVFISGVVTAFIPYNGMSHGDAVKTFPATKRVMTETEATRGNIDKNSPRVTQAVFNLPTKQVNLELLFKKKPIFDENGWTLIKFNYFRNNGRGISFVHSETVRLLPESFSYEDGETSASIIGSYEWLDNLDSYDNLYVTAEFADIYASDKAILKFDPNFAKEVLLSSGKLEIRMNR